MKDSDIVKWVAEQFPPDFKGYALEIGACDGLYLSNTLKLEEAGWDVLCIEPNPIYFEDLIDNRKICVNYACSSENKDGVELMMYDREGIPEKNWAPGEPVSALKGCLSEEFIDLFCPDLRPPTTCLVNVRTLDFCLEEVGFPRLDYLSLDVDGIEAEILKGFDIKRWQTKIVVVENPFKNYDIAMYMIEAGFELVERVHINEIWRRK